MSSNFDRRNFHKLSLAALGGALAGASAGCDSGAKNEPPAKGLQQGMTPDDKPAAVAAMEPHICRGLNACKGQGAGGANDCAGQGDCASTATRHDCASQNACKGQGGCGAKPGQNDCKGMGGCGVPLHSGAWEKARAAFEEKMKGANKTVGAAPEAKS